MTKVSVSEDCGNSPKNIFVQDLTVALAKGDSSFLLKGVSDDVCWNMVGEKSIQGKENFAAALKGFEKAKELIVEHVATHGKAGAVNGKMKMTNGEMIAFCHVFEFSNTKGTEVREITSYMIRTA